MSTLSLQVKYRTLKSVGSSSNFLYSISTSICIRKCNKNWGWFLSHFSEKRMGYSTGKFSEIGSFLKMAITQKFEVGISSNFLHNIRTSICIRKCNKNLRWFLSHFSEKSMGYSTGKFSEIGSFFKMAITQKFEVGISSNFLHSIRTSICIRKYNKNWGWFLSHFSEKSMGYSTGKFSEIGSFFKMAITQKFEVGISSNFLQSIRTSICIRKCNKNLRWFLSHFSEKSMGYSTGKFSEIGSFFKMAITQKFEVGISSNFLHSIRTSICIRKYNKNWGWFLSHFSEKSMGYSTGKFSEIGSFFKMAITQKFEVGISSNFLQSIRTSICIRKCNKNLRWFWSHFSEKSMGYSTGKFSEIGAFFKMAITWKILVRINSNFLNMYQKM